ncbi:MAG: DoxX family membrane protein [Desulfuromonas sp.]|nr:DoxX family membrane protein [Desulfuromonas sp.]
MSPWQIRAVRWLLAAVYLYAGSQKLFAVEAFAAAIGHYQLLPEFGNLLIASVLPSVEIVTALALLSGLWWRAAALISSVLNSMFCIALLSAVVRGLSIDCGCFGSEAGAWSSVEIALLRALGLLGLSLYLLFVQPPSAKE